MVTKIQEIKRQVNHTRDPVDKVDLLNSLSWLLRYEDLKLAEEYALKALEIADWEKYRKGKAYAWLNMGYVHFLKSENQEALEYLSRGLRFFNKQETDKGLPIALNLMGNIHESFGDYETSLEMCLQALNLARQNSFREIEAEVLSVLGLVYSRLSDHERAIQHYQESLEIRSETGDRKAAASSLNRIARIHALKQEYDKALEEYGESLKIREEEKQWSAIPWTYLGMASTYEDMKDYGNAIEYYGKNLESDTDNVDKRCRLQSLIGAGRSYCKLGEHKKAKKLLDEAIHLATSLKAKPLLYEAHYSMALLYKEQKNATQELIHYKKFHEMRDEVHNAEMRNRMKNQQIAFAVEKSEQEKEIFQLRNVELKAAFDEINRKNIEITDSINYASRIQSAILPSYVHMDKFLEENFILFLPRDIVSGDFYWSAVVEGKLVFSAADCTGHGVPGAFMSMLGLAFLDEIVNKRKILSPGKILDELSLAIMKALKQTGSHDEQRDGMDIAICTYDPGRQEILFSGAYNPLYLIRKGEVIEYRGDRMPIGYSEKNDQSFTDQIIPVQKSDIIYLFSDGYADQFGGPKGKKLKYRPFQEYLLQVYDKPMKEQKTLLKNMFVEWRGDNEQIDDVIVLGARF